MIFLTNLRFKPYNLAAHAKHKKNSNFQVHRIYSNKSQKMLDWKKKVKTCSRKYYIQKKTRNMLDFNFGYVLLSTVILIPETRQEHGELNITLIAN